MYWNELIHEILQVQIQAALEKISWPSTPKGKIHWLKWWKIPVDFHSKNSRIFQQKRTAQPREASDPRKSSKNEHTKPGKPLARKNRANPAKNEHP